MIKNFNIINFHKNKIKLQNTIICPVSIENGYYETKVNIFPSRFLYIYKNYAIDLEMKCYYDCIDGRNYKTIQKILETKFDQYKKQELLFAFRSVEEGYIPKEEIYQRIINDFKEGKLKSGNDEDIEKYKEEVKKVKIIQPKIIKRK